MKRGQMKMSFGMLFSILLIIIFIAFAFYAIQKFLDLQDTVKVEQFKESLQNDVDSIWKSSKASQEKNYAMSNNVEQVCFENDRDLILRGPELFQNSTIEHIDTAEDPLCFDNSDGKIYIFLKKDFGDNFVTIGRIGEQ